MLHVNDLEQVTIDTLINGDPVRFGEDLTVEDAWSLHMGLQLLRSLIQVN